jgi:hypothetical protein
MKTFSPGAVPRKKTGKRRMAKAQASPKARNPALEEEPQ